MDKRNDSNEEVHIRAILVDESAGEQQIKEDRQEINSNYYLDRRVKFGMRSECDQGQCANQKDIWIMGSGYGEFELARDTGDLQSSTSTE
ncbi:MAG: hypothetical protein EZS28_043708 [Streblomastix strix]|uniref:Uncharacterized protein n=1 Tax=Streblomastix strix TaxID=222440 RepID=A0A5J4TTS2_9EUKA|nr:MAG: hypothetical protein EZS28_043708 [Streblomastix strix]